MDMDVGGWGVFDRPETLVTVVVVVVLATVVLNIVLRVARAWGLRAQAREDGWRWVGRDRSFAQVVAAAFPQLARAAKRSARNGISRSGNRNSSGGRGIQRAAGMALDLSGAGTRTTTRVRARHVAVAPGTGGEVTVGEALISVQARRRHRSSHNGNGSRNGSSTVRAAAAFAKPGGGLPSLELGPRTLLDRVTGGDDDGLPEELCRRFSVEDLGGRARVALIESGVWRELLTEDVKVQGVRVVKGHVVVMSRRRITRRRARALVAVTERLVAALSAGAQSGAEVSPPSGGPGTAAVTDSPPPGNASAPGALSE